jgi:uncharacterized protein YceK
MRILIILLCLMLSGCASTIKATYDDTGRLVGLEAQGAQESAVIQKADGTVEYRMNNKAEPLIKDIINVQLLKQD